jgi:hypothetical protein
MRPEIHIMPAQTPTLKIITPRAFALAATLMLPIAAGAQVVPPAAIAAPAGPGTVIATPLQDLPSGDSLVDRAGELWSGIIGRFGFGLSTSSFARSAAANAQEQAREDFTWLMDVAGYKLKEIESAVSLFPSLSLTFGMARELTEGDRDYLDRMLERHARNHTGPMAAVQRTIVRAILEASEIGGFSVEKVEVDLFPLPKVKLVMAPSNAPLGIEASRIMRAIDRLSQRVQAAAPRTQGGTFELMIPPSGNAMRPASIDN